MSDAARIDGKAFAEALRARIGAAAAAFAPQAARRPGLAVVLVGEDAASQVYVGAKARACEEAGIASFEHRLPATTSSAELLTLVERLNRDPEVDGILVQLPLPEGLDEQAVIAMLVVYCLKDVSLLQGSHGVPEALGILMTVALHLWQRQMLLSIAGGTVFYMLLVQLVFVK